jgi:hypothetical protein
MQRPSQKLCVAAERSWVIVEVANLRIISVKRKKAQNADKERFWGLKVDFVSQITVAFGHEHLMTTWKPYFEHLQKNKHRFLELRWNRLKQIAVEIVLVPAEETICLQKFEVVCR